ncbi:Acetyltransferase (GNAT) family protein [Actinacidiphila yanglinensis]|uniref:Acetyltransferase (GNAT) family protein n=1 Tax=Actinacidiphila yanglinensis TaxID=310779 RepID=A0A1H6BSA6_9ACTN|nr:GNAT family N-acetyltransferase [Actinacidiphila yanglinensis]SEG63086.1 Acetyltransferase (GNAT) family protein [Actinacidiphila yanglinensis]
MDIGQVRETFDTQMRRGAGELTPEGVVRLVEGEPPGWAAVVWSGFTQDEGERADRAIAAQRDWLASPEGKGREFEWKLYSYDGPADLGERLVAAGFTAEPPETLMVAEVAALPKEPRLPEGVRLETVTDAAGVERVASVHEQAFGRSADRLRKGLLAHLGDPGMRITVAMAGDRPVCGARMEFHPGTEFASLWGGGTLEEWRGRGIYRALVAHRAGVAAARGCRYLQVDASDQSRPILERLGFAALAVTTPYVLPSER